MLTKTQPSAPGDDEEAEQTPRATAQSQRRRSSPGSLAEEDSEQEGSGSTSQQQMVKSLVRLALASEYSRTPIRRSDISARTLESQPRQFKHVFDAAQLALRATFGMELVELPAREKATLNQRRAAQKSQSQSSSSNSNKSWILCSVLPRELRDQAILRPSKAPVAETESAYIGLYTIIVATIALHGGRIPEARLERALARMNAGETTPVDRTDKLLTRMEKQGYIVKIKETSGGEESIEYMVGSRGKVEVGKEGVAGLVRTVYRQNDDDGDAEGDLEKRLERSLKNWVIEPAELPGDRSATMSGTQADGAGAGRKRGRPRRGQAAEGNGDEEDSDDDG